MEPQLNLQTAPLRHMSSVVESSADMSAYPLRALHYVELVAPLWTAHKQSAFADDDWLAPA